MRRCLVIVVLLGASLTALLAAWPVQVAPSSCGVPAAPTAPTAPPAADEPPTVVWAANVSVESAAGCISSTAERAPAAAAAFLVTALTAAAVYQPARRRSENTASLAPANPPAVPRPREHAQL